MGAITDVVKRYVPGSYRAMVSLTSNSSYFQASDLQKMAEYVKFRLFASGGTAVLEASEAAAYDPVLIEFMGKLTTLRFIPAAIDFWGVQLTQKVATGTNESASYPDRREGLYRILDDLSKEVAREFDELAPVYGFRIYGVSGMVPRVSYGDNGRGVLITPDPQDFGSPFAEEAPAFPFP